MHHIILFIILSMTYVSYASSLNNESLQCQDCTYNNYQFSCGALNWEVNQLMICCNGSWRKCPIPNHCDINVCWHFNTNDSDGIF